MLKFLASAALLALTASPAVAAAVVGQPAPAFSVADQSGKTRSLAEFQGKTVVLEWHNPDCPFVQKYYEPGAMQKLQADARRAGVVWLTVNSGAAGKQGHMSAADAGAYMKREGMASTAYLLDAGGAMGKAYGAKTTPNMFVISPAGTLVYAGAIDSMPTADSADIARAENYVTAALADVAAGKAVDPASTRPYGCSVKY
jgi:peroxiredoxin